MGARWETTINYLWTPNFKLAAQEVAFYCQNHDNVSKNNVFWVLPSNTWHNKFTYKAKVWSTFFHVYPWLITFVVISFSSDYPCPTHMTRAVFNAEWKNTWGCWFDSKEVNTYEFLSSFCTFSNHVFRNDTFHNFWPVGETTMKLTADNINTGTCKLVQISYSKIFEIHVHSNLSGNNGILWDRGKWPL